MTTTYSLFPTVEYGDEIKSENCQSPDARAKQRTSTVAAGDRSRLPSMCRITSSSFDPSIVEIPPGDAMNELLKHVRLDPDGGIMNISNEVLQAEQQESKVFALRKNRAEKFGICLIVSRATINTVHIIWHNVFFLNQRFLHEHYLRQLYSNITLSSSHILDFFLALHVLELIIFAYLTAFCLYDMCKVAWHSHSTARADDNGINPKYFYMQRLAWDDFRRVQSFSVVQALRFVHPTLLNRYLESLSVKDTAARYILEKFLKIGPDALTDQELAEHATTVIVQNRNLHGDRHFAMELMRYTPHEIVTEVFKMGQPENHEQNSPLDWTIFEYRRRFELLCILEQIAFSSMIVLAFLVGSFGLLAKLCHSTVLLTDPEVSIISLAVYVIGFTNQVMGVMAVNQLLIWRVQEFMFGGSDSKFSQEEKTIMEAYLAQLAERVCTSDWLNKTQKLAVMLGLDDQDLQQLVIEEDVDDKANVLLGVKAYMKKHGLVSSSRLARWAGGI